MLKTSKESKKRTRDQPTNKTTKISEAQMNKVEQNLSAINQQIFQPTKE